VLPCAAKEGPMKLAVSVRYKPTGWESTGLGWEDYKRMGTVNVSVPYRQAHWVPLWALSNAKLRMVIIERDRLHKENWNDASFNIGKSKKSIRHAGSYRALLAGISYRAWRLRWDSCRIAEEMEITPVSVRQHLFQLIRVARNLEANGWRPIVPEYVEGEICYDCRRRPIHKARCKWRCDKCQDLNNRIARRRARRAASTAKL
jgi:hypothetical protein